MGRQHFHSDNDSSSSSSRRNVQQQNNQHQMRKRSRNRRSSSSLSLSATITTNTIDNEMGQSKVKIGCQKCDLFKSQRPIRHLALLLMGALHLFATVLLTVDAQLTSYSQQQQQYYQQQQQQQQPQQFHPMPYQDPTLQQQQLQVILQQQQQQQQLQHHFTSNRDFSCGKLFYRTFYLDQQRDILYIGAMDNLFKVDLANINRTNCERDAIRMEPSDPYKCVNKGKSENYDCRNHIKVIQPVNKLGDRLYVCGTNAYNPKDYVLTSNLSLSSEIVPGVGQSAHAECPYDPDDNSTAVWVDSGNPSDLPALYSGTTAEMSKADTLIFRTDLYNSTGHKAYEAKRTAKYDSKWLDKPNFVGSFDIGEHVYFFFRESAIEYINCGKSIYSRVARVCKRDNGSKRIYPKEWTTFMKARLNCSIPGDFPFYFDEIQSIYRNPSDERKFHAIFTTSNNGLTGSAICTFTLDAIQQTFNGKFKEQASSIHAWLPVPDFNLNKAEPRPGSCVDNTQTLSDSYVTFMRTHPLMDSAVGHDNGKPVFYRRDVMFTKIVVDIIDIDGFNYTVYFAGTNTGHVYKIVEWYQPPASLLMRQQQQQQSIMPQMLQMDPLSSGQMDPQQQPPSQQSIPLNGQSQSNLIELIEATTPEPVRAIEISTRHKSLYVASDSQVKQISLLNCKQRHDNCLQCIRDPYCGWDKDRQECRHLSSVGPNIIQDVTNDTPGICHNNIKHKEVRVTWGQSVHLPCQISLPYLNNNNNINNGESIQQNSFALMRQQQQLMDGPYSQSPITSQYYPQSSISWYYHRREGVAQGVPVLQRRDKFILAADQGLVIMNANEAGWYQCRLGTQTIYSYNLIVDTKTCSAPSEADIKKVYADWCREMDKYKQSYRQWQAKQNRCQSMSPQQQNIPNLPMIAPENYANGMTSDS